jgi:hypothetical protein
MNDLARLDLLVRTLSRGLPDACATMTPQARKGIRDWLATILTYLRGTPDDATLARAYTELRALHDACLGKEEVRTRAPAPPAGEHVREMPFGRLSIGDVSGGLEAIVVKLDEEEIRRPEGLLPGESVPGAGETRE